MKNMLIRPALTISVFLLCLILSGCINEIDIECVLIELKNGTSKANQNLELNIRVNIKNEAAYSHIDITIPDLENSPFGEYIKSSLTTESTNSHGKLTGKSAEYVIDPKGLRREDLIGSLDAYYVEVHLVDNSGHEKTTKFSIPELIKDRY